ncbi:MAG: hypothetical protein RQ729_11865, partial [Wenzhouxiangellaceae bacterium]|nr:hypothetical protein [Wenzhouxiangellaceae bacterium]
MKIPCINSLWRTSCSLGVVILLAAGLVTTASAQLHFVGIGTNCDDPGKVGDTGFCTAEFFNFDSFGDNHEVEEFYGVIDQEGMNIRFPEIGSAPITAVRNGTVCTPAPVSDAAPIGLVFPCNVPPPNGSVEIGGAFPIPPIAGFVLDVQATVRERDLCDGPNTSGCSNDLNTQQQPASINLFAPAIDVTKSGPLSAKVGDVITYTIGFQDATTGLGFPGFESCSGADTVLGDLGGFEAGVNKTFTYTVSADDPNPLINEATITCGV